MVNRGAYEKLADVQIKGGIIKDLVKQDIESISDIEIYHKKVKTGKRYFSRKKDVRVIKFIIRSEELFVIECMTKNLDLQELAGGNEYEIEYK
ncbi:gp103 [Bacillus phage G]|uniref:Gp103 n=1 Tax=Bacillus phage G TaxID=2884420 RepID=G3MBG5_9CAUD|nr:gp103 [Bacillus phage G]AEO93365.1 gp103 [Bacillus phage G]